MKYFNVAGLNLQVDGADYPYFDKRLEKYSVDKFDKADVTVRFVLNNSIDVELPTHFAESKGRYFFESNDGYGFYDYIDEIKKTVSYMQTNKEWNNITYTFSDLSSIFGIEPEVAVTNVLGHLFGHTLRHFDGVCVHASTIVYNGEAVTFTAPSGTGKSTHTGLWKQFYPDTVVINDDMPALRLVDGEFYAYGTPWSGKTDINENMSAPLKAMVFLERAETCSITELSPMDGVIRMMREIPVSVYKGQADLMMDMFNKLFSNVPAYLLKCNISKNAVDTVKNKLF